MQFERKSQEEVETSLDETIAMMEKEPSLIKLKNFKRLLFILNHQGYEVRKYSEMYNGLWLLYIGTHPEQEY